MTIGRREMLGAGLALGAIVATSPSVEAGRRRSARKTHSAGLGIDARELDVTPDTGRDVSSNLQKAINEATKARRPLLLAPGKYQVANIKLGTDCHLVGVPGITVLEYGGGGKFLTAANVRNVRLEGLLLDGMHKPLDPDRADGLIMAYACRDLVLRDLIVRNSLINGISLRRSSGRVSDCSIFKVGQAGLRSIDAGGLEITHNTVTDCANNGIQVWRSQTGEDGTIVTANRISRIETRSGGSGQNGNGVSIFRAGSVLVSGNRITDCAYSAIRGNAASNMQMVANSCERLGEVALYAEFGFEGALIANNLVDVAATGIAVTNFNEGGRLAVIQGNIIRNLVRRDHEVHDKRGNGIGVEADAVVTGNVIEAAQSSGIIIGWGRFMRDVTVTSNLIRTVGLGIGITASPEAGACLVAQNMISGTVRGAIRAMDHARPSGPDLARQDRDTALRIGTRGSIRLQGNVAV